MANLLTGDYSAVLQVSEATINRLLASMHQNAWQDTNTPSFPHSVGLRLGDDGPIDGVQGTAWAQIGVPRLRLIDGSTDSFEVAVGLRMRYRPDDDTTPMPVYSHGTLHARYQITPISPDCFGWGRVASQYLWLSVVDGSVSFVGSFGDDDLSVTGLIDEAAASQELSTQLAWLLGTTFAATPQRMSGRFHQHLFKSIVEYDGAVSEASSLPWVPDVPIGGNAVAIPIDLGGGEPSPASINTIEHTLLNGRDFGAAVSRDMLMGAVEPALNQFRNYSSATTVSWSVGWGPLSYDDSTVYHANVNQAWADWIPQDTSAVIQITANGHAHTNSVLPDFDFTIVQPLRLGFDPNGETLWLSPEGTTVSVVGSVSLPGGVWNTVAKNVANTVQNVAASGVNDPGVLSALASFSSHSAEVAEQLKKLDAKADAHFDEASFYLSGIVFRGWVSVASRRRPQVKFDKVDDDTFSALQSWIPAGRIDHLRWSWTWTWQGHDPGQSVEDDRFVLRRPLRTFGRFGPVLGRAAIPGLDGDGTVCLSLSGVVVNRTTGQFEGVEATMKCQRFGFGIPWRVDRTRLLSREYAEAHPPGEPHPPGPVETGLQEVTLVGGDGERQSSNTLVVFVHERWNDEDAHALIDGVARCTREDAGLLVALVFREGALHPAERDAAADHARAIAGRLEAPIVVSEDVHASWSRALAIDADNDGPSWRLLSPDGGLLWKEDERVEAGELAHVLDGCLYPSPRATPAALRVDVEWGADALTNLLTAGHRHWPTAERAPCPPFDGVRPGDVPLIVSDVSFVRKDGDSSTAELDRLRAHNEGRGAQDPGVLLVVDGASDDDVRELSESLGPAFMVVADPDGSVAAGAGVRSWPTTVPIGEGGEG